MAENRRSPSCLAKRLEEQGCSCSFATSYREAHLLLSGQDFDVVFSPMTLRGIRVSPLIELLEGSRVTLFYSHLVEQGCWWLPALRRGEKCFGSAAFRSSEFLAVLDEVIAEIRMERQVMRALQQPTPSAPSVLEMPSRNQPAYATPVQPSEFAKHTLLKRLAR
jgi:hypothetical protein